MKKVLIVDDSISIARQLEKILGAGNEFAIIGHAKNGLEGMKMYQSEHPDIVCMDVNMPIMDGLTALRNIMALDKNAKIVMITSLGGVGDKFTEALKLGARNVISKPFEPDAVIQTLRHV